METLYIYMLAWFGMVFIAILNGIVREKYYARSMSELAAHQLSTISAIILFGIYIFILSRLQSVQSAGQAFTMGTVWLIMTVLFEFLFGHYVAGHSWSRLLEDYKIHKGRLWLLVLLWIFFSPYIFYKL